MRLWSLHPRYLDPKGLVALWREALLAQTVLAGMTRGYRHHPQLERFRAQTEPLAAIGGYLVAVGDEATARGYRFDLGKIRHSGTAVAPIAVTRGQMAWEWGHLMHKLATRDPARRTQLAAVAVPDPHPLFVPVDGPIAAWERI